MRFDSDMTQISGQKNGGWSLWVRVKQNNKRWEHGGCNAFDTTTWYRTYYTIVPLTPKKEKGPQITRPDGLIGKNPCRNATQL